MVAMTMKVSDDAFNTFNDNILFAAKNLRGNLLFRLNFSNVASKYERFSGWKTMRANLKLNTKRSEIFLPLDELTMLKS